MKCLLILLIFVVSEGCFVTPDAKVILGKIHQGDGGIVATFSSSHRAFSLDNCKTVADAYNKRYPNAPLNCW